MLRCDESLRHRVEDEIRVQLTAQLIDPGVEYLRNPLDRCEFVDAPRSCREWLAVDLHVGHKAEVAQHDTVVAELVAE